MEQFLILWVLILTGFFHQQPRTLQTALCPSALSLGINALVSRLLLHPGSKRTWRPLGPFSFCLSFLLLPPQRSLAVHSGATPLASCKFQHASDL